MSKETKTFSRDEINNIVKQLQAIEANGEPVFAVHQEDAIRGINVQVKIPGIGGNWMHFPLHPDEPDTRVDIRLKTMSTF